MSDLEFIDRNDTLAIPDDVFIRVLKRHLPRLGHIYVKSVVEYEIKDSLHLEVDELTMIFVRKIIVEDFEDDHPHTEEIQKIIDHPEIRFKHARLDFHLLSFIHEHKTCKMCKKDIVDTFAYVTPYGVHCTDCVSVHGNNPIVAMNEVFSVYPAFPTYKTFFNIIKVVFSKQETPQEKKIIRSPYQFRSYPEYLEKKEIYCYVMFCLFARATIFLNSNLRSHRHRIYTVLVKDFLILKERVYPDLIKYIEELEALFEIIKIKYETYDEHIDTEVNPWEML